MLTNFRLFVLIIAFNCYGISNLLAFEYTIQFSATGAGTTVGDVLVQNLTKCTSVTVPAGNELVLQDFTSNLTQNIGTNDSISFRTNQTTGKIILTFIAKQSGPNEMKVFGIDGKLNASFSTILEEGENSFQLSLSKGIYIVRIVGTSYAYTGKIYGQSSGMNNAEINFIGRSKGLFHSRQKVQKLFTTLLCSANDHLLYKATSGSYCTLISDQPNASKTINFDFVECKDASGNNYATVKIGNQVWMAENLNTTKYRNGNTIPYISDASAWSSSSTPAWCEYGNNGTNALKYGKLYNWYTLADSRGVAPIGWHLPSDNDWINLQAYVIANGGNYDDTFVLNKIGKSLAARTDWNSSISTGVIGNDLLKNNSTGYTALPGGYRHYNGTFVELGNYAYWWSSTESTSLNKANYRYLSWSYYGLIENGGAYKTHGYSIRCLKD